MALADARALCSVLISHGLVTEFPRVRMIVGVRLRDFQPENADEMLIFTLLCEVMAFEKAANDKPFT
jgi:hypothetical protein